MRGLQRPQRPGVGYGQVGADSGRGRWRWSVSVPAFTATGESRPRTLALAASVRGNVRRFLHVRCGIGRCGRFGRWLPGISR